MVTSFCLKAWKNPRVSPTPTKFLLALSIAILKSLNGFTAFSKSSFILIVFSTSSLIPSPLALPSLESHHGGK